MALDVRDIAFALDGLSGVGAVYSVAQRPSAPEGPAVFVEFEGDMRSLVAAHYALLRFMMHEECARIAFGKDVPSTFAPRASGVHLSAAERSAASMRVGARSRTIAIERAEQERLAEVAASEAHARAQKAALDRSIALSFARIARLQDPATVLIVADDSELLRVARDAFPDGEIVAVATVGEGFAHLRARRFDLVLCDAQRAFGAWLFLAEVKRSRLRLQPELALYVAVDGEERARASGSGGAFPYTGCLVKPVTPDVLWAARESFFRQVDMPDPSTSRQSRPPMAHAVEGRGTSSPGTSRSDLIEPRDPTRRARVLVIDDRPDAEALRGEWSADLYVIVTADPFEALEKVAHADLDLVACSASLRTSDGQPIYRLLWNARPTIKSRFVLILGPGEAPASVRDSRKQTVLSRPVTLGKLAAMVSSRPRSPELK